MLCPRTWLVTVVLVDKKLPRICAFHTPQNTRHIAQHLGIDVVASQGGAARVKADEVGCDV